MVGLDEYRLDCITRSAFADVKEIDDAYNKLCTVSILSLCTALAENFIQLITSECHARSLTAAVALKFSRTLPSVPAG